MRAKEMCTSRISFGFLATPPGESRWLGGGSRAGGGGEAAGGAGGAMAQGGPGWQAQEDPGGKGCSGGRICCTCCAATPATQVQICSQTW